MHLEGQISRLRSSKKIRVGLIGLGSLAIIILISAEILIKAHNSHKVDELIKAAQISLQEGNLANATKALEQAKQINGSTNNQMTLNSTVNFDVDARPFITNVAYQRIKLGYSASNVVDSELVQYQIFR